MNDRKMERLEGNDIPSILSDEQRQLLIDELKSEYLTEDDRQEIIKECCHEPSLRETSSVREIKSPEQVIAETKEVLSQLETIGKVCVSRFPKVLTQEELDELLVVGQRFLAGLEALEPLSQSELEELQEQFTFEICSDSFNFDAITGTPTGHHEW